MQCRGSALADGRELLLYVTWFMAEFRVLGVNRLFRDDGDAVPRRGRGSVRHIPASLPAGRTPPPGGYNDYVHEQANGTGEAGDNGQNNALPTHD